jgi:hypothetical protein
VSVTLSPIAMVDGVGQPFVDDFNDDRDKLRVVAVVSPTCVDCLNAVRSIRRAIQAGPTDAPIAASILWVDVTPFDSADEVERVTRLVDIEGVRQYHDPTGWTGRRVAASLGFPEQLAWDVFLLYRPGLAWNEKPPAPTEWVHQLDYSKWADPALLRTGPALLRYFKSAFRRLATRPD